MSRVRCLLGATILFAGLPAAAASGITAVLTSCREGWVEINDPASLQPLGRIQVGANTNGVDAGADGTTLFVTSHLRSDPIACCALYAIDLSKHDIAFVFEPSGSPTVIPRRNLVLTQEGDNGIFIFDAKSLKRKLIMSAPGVYGLRPSPDGRWLFGLTSWQGPSLDIFDLQTRQLVRRIRIPYETFAGAWSGNSFYLYAFDGEDGHLWKVAPSSVDLGSEVRVEIPALSNLGARYIPLDLAVANGHLLLHEVFGMKIDRRASSNSEEPGGTYKIDPETGAVTAWLAPDMHFARLKVTPDGETIYGIDVESLNTWAHSRLVKIDRSTGKVEASRELSSDVWGLGLAQIPASLIPSGDIELTRISADKKD